MSRNLIEVTAALARAADEEALALRLLSACVDEAVALERPADHQGDERVDMFRVGYSIQQVRKVLAVLDWAELQSGREPPVHRLVGFRAAWLEYGDWLRAEGIG